MPIFTPTKGAPALLHQAFQGLAVVLSWDSIASTCAHSHMVGIYRYAGDSHGVVVHTTARAFFKKKERNVLSAFSPLCPVLFFIIMYQLARQAALVRFI